MPVSEQSTRSYDIPGALAAILVSGKNNRGSCTGDAVLIDLSSGVLAVADGPERNPSASSAFLSRFAKALEGSFTKENSDMDERFPRLVQIAHRLMEEATYHECTTFSAVVIGDDKRAAMLHTGDSLIFLIRDGWLIQLSRTNHFMVGRSARLFQSELVPLRDGDLLFLATDGINEMARFKGMHTEFFLSQMICGSTPAGIAQTIAENAQGIICEHDDIAVLAAHPERITTGGRLEANARIILKDERV